ncbi:MAG: hypothetical protein N4J56_000835 [Chroococcidiopsis sp. SAG 2025]|nr:hypothetical protein [Chroococcidiopsis sp. SAG 2025]
MTFEKELEEITALVLFSSASLFLGFLLFFIWAYS